jgi:hypothetical protein
MNFIKRLQSHLTGKPVDMGISVSFNSDKITGETLASAKALPVSSYSAKYEVDTKAMDIYFELVSMKRNGSGKSIYELRCVETGEIICIDKTAFDLLFVKIKVKK